MIFMFNTILNRDNVIATKQEGGNILRRWITNKRKVPEVLSIANEEEIREPDYKISNPLKLSDNTLVRCAFGNVFHISHFGFVMKYKNKDHDEQNKSAE